jgi:hypothetical protein
VGLPERQPVHPFSVSEGSPSLFTLTASVSVKLEKSSCFNILSERRTFTLRAPHRMADSDANRGQLGTELVALSRDLSSNLGVIVQRPSARMRSPP